MRIIYNEIYYALVYIHEFVSNLHMFILITEKNKNIRTKLKQFQTNKN
jgi:hypothetical protein